MSSAIVNHWIIAAASWQRNVVLIVFGLVFFCHLSIHRNLLKYSVTLWIISHNYNFWCYDLLWMVLLVHPSFSNTFWSCTWPIDPFAKWCWGISHFHSVTGSLDMQNHRGAWLPPCHDFCYSQNPIWLLTAITKIQRFCFSRYMRVQYLNSNWNWCAKFDSDIVLTIRGHLHLHRSW